MTDAQIVRLLEKNNEKLIVRINEGMHQAIEDNNRIICDLLRQEIRASANGVKSELRQEMQVMKAEIIEGVAHHIDTALLPQIDDLDRRVTVLEAKILAA